MITKLFIFVSFFLVSCCFVVTERKILIARKTKKLSVSSAL